MEKTNQPQNIDIIEYIGLNKSKPMKNNKSLMEKTKRPKNIDIIEWSRNCPNG